MPSLLTAKGSEHTLYCAEGVSHAACEPWQVWGRSSGAQELRSLTSRLKHDENTAVGLFPTSPPPHSAGARRGKRASCKRAERETGHLRASPSAEASAAASRRRSCIRTGETLCPTRRLRIEEGPDCQFS
eukprot:scaffold90_cov264-Pinguiococcus_pyrenoidosus.AAC.12